MELYLHHGRDKPDQTMNDWGPNGPRLQGVVGIHQTYGNPANVFFESPQACETARLLTGWENFEDKALTMAWEDDLIRVLPPGAPAAVYYGDWGIM
jgi:hypothetical protein